MSGLNPPERVLHEGQSGSPATDGAVIEGPHDGSGQRKQAEGQNGGGIGLVEGLFAALTQL